MNRRLSWRPNRLALACGLATMAIGGQALASGFAVPEISTFGLGTANAVVANPDELGAIPYNPAAMAFHPTSLSVGAMVVAPSLEVTTGNGNFESRGSDYVGIPQFQGTYQLNNQFTLGLGVSAPFGLESDWDSSAPVFTGFPGGLAALHPTKSKIELLDFTPTVAMRVNDNLSLAAGLDYYWVKKVVFSAPVADSKGDGDGLGYNLSALFVKDRWSAGISYHSRVDADIKGTTTFPLGLAAPPTAPGTSAAAQADLPIPWRLQAGVRYEYTDALAVEFDITRTGWSSFKTLTINNAISPVSSTNNWKDANAYRIGGTYQLNGTTQLRFGYTFDETGQQAANFSPRIPDADRHLFSIGLGHQLGNGWAVEAGYMYVLFEDNNYTSATAYAGPPADSNGTSAVNGNYEANVHLFGLSVSKTF